jgi:glycosyltransferase involved in cell wall biosynthesis
MRLAFSVRGEPVLFIVAQPPFLPAVGYLQKKLLGRKYVVWIDDVYPDVIERRHVSGRKSLLMRGWRRFNRAVLGEAEHVFTLGPYMKQVVRQYVPAEVQITVVPTWVDTDLICPVPKGGNPFAVKYGQCEKITVMYSGNLGLTHDVGSIIDVARRLRSRADIHFMIIGAGPQWKSLKESICEESDKNITLLPLQPYEILPYSLATADLAIVSQESGMEGISMPSKTYYSLAAGSAILAICPPQCDLGYVVASNDCGVIVEPGACETLAAQIERLASTPDELDRLRKNARRAAEELYSRKVNSQRVRDVMEPLLPKRGALEDRN